MKFSLCCAARVLSVGTILRKKIICSRCAKECKPVQRGTWKNVYEGK